MNNDPIYDTIKKTVLSFLPDARVLLFGSRAKGTFDLHSDYDLLVITPMTFTRKESLDWASKLDKAIVKAIHAPIDLLLYSEKEIEEKKELPGHIVRLAIKEAIAL